MVKQGPVSAEADCETSRGRNGRSWTRCDKTPTYSGAGSVEDWNAAPLGDVIGDDG